MGSSVEQPSVIRSRYIGRVVGHAHIRNYRLFASAKIEHFQVLRSVSTKFRHVIASKPLNKRQSPHEKRVLGGIRKRKLA